MLAVILNEVIHVELLYSTWLIVRTQKCNDGGGMSIYFLHEGHCIKPQNPKPGLTTELENCFLSFSYFIRCRVFATKDREETGFQNMFFQCFNKNEMINQITFPVGSPSSKGCD